MANTCTSEQIIFKFLVVQNFSICSTAEYSLFEPPRETKMDLKNKSWVKLQCSTEGRETAVV